VFVNHARCPSAAALVVLAVIGLTSARLGAQESAPPEGDKATAELLFDQGRKLLVEGNLEEACAKLEASRRLEAAVGTLLNLGDCYEKRGRTATAWTTYRAAASLAEARQDPKRAEFARKRASTVESHLATITIRSLGGEPGLVVKRDGIVVDEAARGTAVPADPGPHTVEASAPDRLPFSTIAAVPAEAQLVVEIPPLAVGSDTATRESGRARSPASSRSPLRMVGLVGGAVGIAALGVGTGFAIRAKTKWDEADGAHCDAGRTCDDAGLKLNRDARAAGDVATPAFLAGLVLVAGGALAYFLAPRAAKQGSAIAAARQGLNFVLP
jgi:hypothetical protein